MNTIEYSTDMLWHTIELREYCEWPVPYCDISTCEYIHSIIDTIIVFDMSTSMPH